MVAAVSNSRLLLQDLNPAYNMLLRSELLGCQCPSPISPDKATQLEQLRATNSPAKKILRFKSGESCSCPDLLLLNVVKHTAVVADAGLTRLSLIKKPRLAILIGLPLLIQVMLLVLWLALLPRVPSLLPQLGSTAWWDLL